MKLVALVIASLTLFACGGVADPAPPASDAAVEAAPSPDAGVSPEASPDADGCWRCADRAWRNVCVVPAEVADDAMSCAMCGERCNSTPDAAGSDQ